MDLLNGVGVFYHGGSNSGDAAAKTIVKTLRSFSNITSIVCSSPEGFLNLIKANPNYFFIGVRSYIDTDTLKKIDGLNQKVFWAPAVFKSTQEDDLRSLLKRFIRWRILVVDDDEDFNNELSDYLRGLGHKVTQAFGGKEAFKLIKDNESNSDKTELLIIDQQLGEDRDWWGSEVIRMVQDRVKSPIKTILMSSEKVVEHTANAFLLKSFGHDAFGDQVQRID